MDKTIKVWNIKTAKTVKTFRGHQVFMGKCRAELNVYMSRNLVVFRVRMIKLLGIIYFG
jgi:WD40 repeat protein